MDKHNKQQKNKNNGSVKPSAPQAKTAVLPEPSAVREDAAALKGKKLAPPAAKKK